MCQLACYPSSRCHLEPLLMDETLQKFDGQIRIYGVCEYFHFFFFQFVLGILLDRLQIHTFTLNFFGFLYLSLRSTCVCRGVKVCL